jgi:hypothetical protein
MGKKQKQLIVRVLVMLVPTYSVAYISEAMIYTMPMLAVCTLIAANLYGEEEAENRVDEDGSPDGDGLDGGDLDG